MVKKTKKNNVDFYEKTLFEALKKREINCIHKYKDKHKEIDITIPDAKLHIEVDGSQHFNDYSQIKSDLARAHYSKKEGFETIHIPNEAVWRDVGKIADAIAKLVKERGGYSKIPNEKKLGDYTKKKKPKKTTKKPKRDLSYGVVVDKLGNPINLTAGTPKTNRSSDYTVPFENINFTLTGDNKKKPDYYNPPKLTYERPISSGRKFGFAILVMVLIIATIFLVINMREGFITDTPKDFVVAYGISEIKSDPVLEQKLIETAKQKCETQCESMNDVFTGEYWLNDMSWGDFSVRCRCEISGVSNYSPMILKEEITSSA